DAHYSGRQRLAEVTLLVVLELNVDADLLLNRLAGVVVALVVILLAVQDEFFFDVEVGGREQADLLRLIILERRRALQRVEVVFKECLLLKLRSGRGLSHLGSAGST